MANIHIVVAATKSWNITNYRTWGLPRGFQKHLITDPKKLTYEYLRKLNPRFVFFPHWSWIIPKEIYEHFACVVFHSANLPVGRGGSPIQNHIVRGIYRINVCALRVVGELDAGPVYMKRPVNIAHGSAEEILKNISAISFRMMSEIIKKNPKAVPQRGVPVVWKRRKPDESRIPALPDERALYDFIRMLDAEGYPAAFLEYNGWRYDFSDARLADGAVTANVRVQKISINQHEQKK